MSNQIQYELHLLFVSLATGAGLMICYDLLRIFRILIPHGVWWTGLEDLGYWLYTCWIIFSLLYRENDGVIRAYMIICIFVGMLIFKTTVSAFFLKLLKKWHKYFTMKLKHRNQSRRNTGGSDVKIQKRKKK